MASIIIRNLDERVAARLRVQARLQGVSVERMARRILAEGTALGRAEIAARARAIRARQKQHRSRAAQIVRDSGEPELLRPMSSRERWVVHNALKDERGVRSESEGEGPRKRVRILPD